MSELREQITATIEPGKTAGLVGGRQVQLVTVIMSDPPSDPDDLPTPQLPAASVMLSPRQARGLGLCLLELAEAAEQVSR